MSFLQKLIYCLSLSHRCSYFLFNKKLPAFSSIVIQSVYAPDILFSLFLSNVGTQTGHSRQSNCFPSRIVALIFLHRCLASCSLMLPNLFLSQSTTFAMYYLKTTNTSVTDCSQPQAEDDWLLMLALFRNFTRVLFVFHSHLALITSLEPADNCRSHCYFPSYHATFVHIHFCPSAVTLHYHFFKLYIF